MIRIGTYNNLNVVSKTAAGLVLSDDEEEVLLPFRDVPKDAEVGDSLFVFVYNQKDGKPVATTKRPEACVGDFAFLKIVEVNEKGAFADIGIDKDIFIPAKEQKHPMQRGNKYVVYLYLDEYDGRLTASSWLEDFVETDLQNLEEGDEVSLLISEESELGYSAIIDNKYIGLLYRNELYEDLKIGESRKGYIKKIRPEDKKIDLSLRVIGFDFILDSKGSLLEILKENDGVLHLGDKSDPEEIRKQLKMSKKAFKQVIGGLYKERLITISDHEIRLVTPSANSEE